MLDQTKQALSRAALALKKYVWALLLALYPIADQIIGWAEDHLPLLAPYMGQNVFRYMGLAIVVAKLLLQLYRAWLQFRAWLRTVAIA